MSALEKLVSLGSPALTLPPNAASVSSALEPLLGLKNGFYAFESALHVLPSRRTTEELGLDEWNAEVLWRAEYEGMADGAFFFAEDALGVQFCLRDGVIQTFEPETGAFTELAPDIEGWAQRILDDWRVLTAHPLAHDWQEIHGRLPLGQRLMPKIPFVLGGEFTLQNIFAIDAVKGMQARANIAVQIRDLPDGAKVELKVVE